LCTVAVDLRWDPKPAAKADAPFDVPLTGQEMNVLGSLSVRVCDMSAHPDRRFCYPLQA
jgi:hypothetical protein